MNKVKIKNLAPQLMSKAEQVKQIRPRRTAWVVVAVVTLTLAQPTVALAALAWSHYRVYGTFWRPEELRIAAPITAHFDGQDGWGQSVVEVNTRFGRLPMADVQVHSSGYASTVVWAFVDYDVGTNQLGQPGNPPTEVPVRVTVRGHASSDVGGTAYASVTIQGPEGQYSSHTPPDFNKTVTLQAEIGTTYMVQLYVLAEVDSSPEQWTVEAQAVADPLFELDQDAFDAQRAEQGLPTFTLADYYELEFSPNILAGDLDGDDDVDLVDFSILARQWRQAPGEPSADIAPPGEPDGIADVLDLAVFCAYWLEGTNP